MLPKDTPKFDENDPNERCKAFTSSLNDMAQKDLFKHLSADIINTACNIIMSFLDPELTPEQGQKHFGINPSTYNSNVSRKVMKKDIRKIRESTPMIRRSILAKIFNKS